MRFYPAGQHMMSKHFHRCPKKHNKKKSSCEKWGKKLTRYRQAVIIDGIYQEKVQFDGIVKCII
jgi:hypothetical protein